MIYIYAYWHLLCSVAGSTETLVPNAPFHERNKIVLIFDLCIWRPLYEFYLLEKAFLKELEEGIHCVVEREKKVARPDFLNCDINSSGIPKQAIFNKLFLRCEDIGPSPEYIVYRTWFEEKDIFEDCQSV